MMPQVLRPSIWSALLGGSPLLQSDGLCWSPFYETFGGIMLMLQQHQSVLNCYWSMQGYLSFNGSCTWSPLDFQSQLAVSKEVGDHATFARLGAGHAIFVGEGAKHLSTFGIGMHHDEGMIDKSWWRATNHQSSIIMHPFIHPQNVNRVLRPERSGQNYTKNNTTSSQSSILPGSFSEYAVQSLKMYRAPKGKASLPTNSSGHGNPRFLHFPIFMMASKHPFSITFPWGPRGSNIFLKSRPRCRTRLLTVELCSMLAEINDSLDNSLKFRATHRNFKKNNLHTNSSSSIDSRSNFPVISMKSFFLTEKIRYQSCNKLWSFTWFGWMRLWFVVHLGCDAGASQTYVILILEV